MHEILSQIDSPAALKDLTLAEQKQLAREIRDVLCSLVATRSAHFASNLGVVELCIALHASFDFSHDRLIWDTGHQTYPHKLVTGRYGEFGSMRTKGGLMGYPNPAESPYDLFMTGHAGCSISSALGLRTADEVLGQDDRYSVAVVGDGAFSCGTIYEAMNNAGGMKKNKLIVILNDNKMSICPRVGGIADYLDRLRTAPFYTGIKTEVVKILNKVPLLGDPVERFLAQLKNAIKAGLHGGMLFEDLGFRYIGPIDGHDIGLVRKYLKMVKKMVDPVLLHVVTGKGRGFQPAEDDPVFFHAPPALEESRKAELASVPAAPKRRAFTDQMSAAILDQMRRNERVTVLTAAMCQGNKLDQVREEFPQRFFDTGICESHAVAFAAGQAKAGLRPIVDIYSTFLQRSFDQIFQEASLQNLPVIFTLDRAGLTGPDGPTHHGVFDLAYMRIFPNMVVMAPGDAADVDGMLDLAVRHDGPSSIRYPKAVAEALPGDRTPVVLGKAEVVSEGRDGVILCCGAQLPDCISAAQTLLEEGLQVGVVNARFVKPLDRTTILSTVRKASFTVTVEEGCLAGGFGSAVLEVVADAGLNTAVVHRLGIPDRYVEHGTRSELLADLGFDVSGIVRTCRQAAQQAGLREFAEHVPSTPHSPPLNVQRS